jgi:iron complex outermembrane receptor protein
VFLYEELPFRHVSLQFGGRIDHTSFDPDASALPDRDGLLRRRFTELSGSAGLLAHLRDDLALALNVARAARNPSLEELYNFGPHAGNFSFEIGNSLLDSEVGTGVDLSLRYRSPRLVAEASVFRNSIDDFIFAFPTGEVEDDLPVVSFLAADSLLQGFELHADVGLTPRLWVELGADGVRGELRSEDQPLPRMPPYRAWLGLRYQTGALHVEALLRGAARQDRVFGAEQPTPGYAVVDLHGSYTFTRGETAHVVTLRLDNAGDELYRNHLSFIKARAPEMGRSLKLVYTLRF